jgi:hypothetical protein
MKKKLFQLIEHPASHYGRIAVFASAAVECDNFHGASFPGLTKSDFLNLVLFTQAVLHENEMARQALSSIFPVFI